MFNNKKLISVLALLLCVVMLTATFVSCNSDKKDPGQHDGTPETPDNDQDDKQTPDGAKPIDFSKVDLSKVAYYKPESPVGYIEKDGGKVVPEYIIKVNGIPVSLDEFRYPYLNIKKTKDNGDDTLWTDAATAENRLGEEDVAQLKIDALEYTKQTLFYQFMAALYDLPLTEEENKKIDDDIAETVKNMNVEGSQMTYEQALTQSFYTDGLYRYTLSLYTTAAKIFNHLYFDEGAALAMTSSEALQYLKDKEYIRTQQIFVKFPAAPTEGTDEEKAAAVQVLKADTKKKAEDILAKVKAGEDFMTLVEEYNEDPGMKSSGADGYYFNKDTNFYPSYIEASYALAEGAASDLVESDAGYHIIKRMPLEEEYVGKNAQTLLNEKYSTDFQSIIEATTKNFKIEYAPEYEFITPTTLK